MGNKVSLEEEMINLRIVSKQMQRSSKKCEKNEKAALEKLKKVNTSYDIFVHGFLLFYWCKLLVQVTVLNYIVSVTGFPWPSLTRNCFSQFTLQQTQKPKMHTQYFLILTQQITTQIPCPSQNQYNI